MRSGERVAAVDVGMGHVLLNTETPLGMSAETYLPSKAYLLNANGRLQQLQLQSLVV